MSELLKNRETNLSGKTTNDIFYLTNPTFFNGTRKSYSFGGGAPNKRTDDEKRAQDETWRTITDPGSDHRSVEIPVRSVERMPEGPEKDKAREIVKK